MSGLATRWIAVMRPPSMTVVNTATGFPPAVITVPVPPLISVISAVRSALSMPM